ncbi:T9SS type A sorting domain-containing protein [Epilithonimonas hungarica]|uniref:Por secretion system C-terminal sorting domain-containing protein n=1 Tax=Epilithonimonas hungarica TaxID=454006 RepID=A0A1G7H8K4_9FLAO|nr:T9SS type A sorting domain-containing protein [Epilithonimonas hungarica]SDE96762.1 Por secretion system C-terminal sorting domain-containing protein [Epilithonimonas hungarica]
MRKLYLMLVLLLIAMTNTVYAQTSTEQFETESNGSSSFTDNGVIFNIISHVNTYDIQAAYPGTGWNGTAADNRYIDNSGSGNQSAGTSFSIKTTSNLFKVNRFWVYAAAANTTLGVAGTLTITGKLSGVTKFTQTKTTGFTAAIGTTNGYTLIDMTNLNGQNYSNIIIDQLQITAGGNFQYLGLDAFTWVKDSGVVAGTLALASSQTNVSCNGGSNGTATVTASGGTAPYTYSWTPSGGTAATATGLAAGTYTVTVKDATNTTKTQSFTITEPTALVAAAVSQTNVACNGGATGAATVSASGGTPGYTYSWSPSGGTAASATGLTAGTYTVTITDANACQTTQSFTITQPTALSVTTSQTNVACNGGSTGSASVSVSGGTPGYTYSWSPSGGTAASATGLTAGTYTVTIKDANNCQTTRSFTITQPTALSVTTSQTNVACNGGSTGSASVSVSGGTPGYTYSWSPSGGTAASATGLTAGTYTVTIKDANNCQTTRSFTITQPTALSVTTSQTNVACNGGSTGSASVGVSGGTPGYTYSWSPSGGTAASATGLAAGTYTVTITDGNNCQTTRSFTITQPTALSATTSQTNVACNGGSTGSASVSVSGGTPGYTYSWSPSGGTAASATGLTAGTYTVTITDGNNCQTTRSFTITQPTALSATTSQTNVACNGGSTGSASVSVSGGTPGYTYSWSPSGGTAASATGLTAGTYTVTITDANACQTTQSFTITQPTALSATTSQTNVACNGGSTGSASVSVSGGTPGYTYSWAPSGGTAASATGLAAGTYTVTIKDANNCQTTRSFTITQPTALVATAVSQTNVACNGDATGAATVSVSGGTPGYTYSWSPSGGTAASATGLAAGTYTVTIKDANNCQTTQSFTITQTAAISAPSGATDQTFDSGDDLSALVVNGQNIKWYASASDATSHINVLPMSTLLVTNTIYYATQTIGGCESKASLAVKATDITLGVVNGDKLAKMLIYPNPVNDILRFSGNEKISKIVILSLDGKKIMEKMMNDDKAVNVHNLVQGNYIINIFTEKGIQTIKFIKK